MKIIKTSLPVYSILANNNKKYNYIDSFQGSLIDQRNRFSSIDVARAFFSSAPKWVDKLFTLRNKIVSLFGLKTIDKSLDRQTQLDNFKGEPGEQLGLFKVFHRTDNELLLGEDDKHLNFRVSLFVEQSVNDSHIKTLTISTTVEFNNWLGRLYFVPVRPFHKLIVPSMLKGIIKELEKQEIKPKQSLPEQ